MNTATSAPLDCVRIGIVSVSDRASSGVYVDKGLPALQDWLTRALKNPIEFESRLIADEQISISFRSRLLSLTIRMYTSITGRRGKPSVSDAR